VFRFDEKVVKELKKENGPTIKLQKMDRRTLYVIIFTATLLFIFSNRKPRARMEKVVIRGKNDFQQRSIR
jgi:hypothetical protein